MDVRSRVMTLLGFSFFTCGRMLTASRSAEEAVGIVRRISATCRVVAAMAAVLFLPHISIAQVFLDNFNDDSRSGNWSVVTNGSGPTVSEQNQRVEVTTPADSHGVNGLTIFSAGFGFSCLLPGDFDIQVDFELIEWPEGGGGNTNLATNEATIDRASNEGMPPRESYFVNFYSEPHILTEAFGSGLSGKLRQTRTGSVAAAYYFSDGAWVLLDDAPALGNPTNVCLSSGGREESFAGQQVTVAYDNFQINAGTPDCPCGDGRVQFTEECDGADDSACPGLCASDCSCPVSCPSTPLGSCGGPGKAVFKVKDNPDNSKDQIKWKWLKGGAQLSEFGMPAIGTSYTLCIYDSSGGVASLSGSVGVTPGAGWALAGSRAWKYKDKAGASDGVKVVKLKAGSLPKASIGLTAKGAVIPMPVPVSPDRFFDQDSVVLVQLVNSEDACWASEFVSAKKNTGDQFKAKAP